MPLLIPIYRQNKGNAARCKAMGCTHVFGYEPELDRSVTPPVPTVTMPAWKAAFAAVGMTYICEPSGNPKADAADPNFAGWLFPIDEVDAQILNCVERGDTAGAESLYAQAEAFGAACLAAAPNVDRWINLDGNQVRWHSKDGKVNYPRLLAPFTKVSVDYYPVQRGEPLSVLGDVLDLFLAVAGPKAAMAFVECSDQNLPASDGYKSRAPTVEELGIEAGMIRDRNLAIGYFPQRLPQDPPPAGNGVGFVWNNMTPDLAAAVTAINQSVAVPPPPGVPPMPIISDEQLAKTARIIRRLVNNNGVLTANATAMQAKIDTLTKQLAAATAPPPASPAAADLIALITPMPDPGT